MSTLPRFAIVLLLSLSCAALPKVASSQTKTQKKPSMNSVSGRITIRGKSAPGIVVGIRDSDFSPQPSPALRATSDQDGNYLISNIPSGNYQISPIAPAFVVFDPVWPGARAKTLLLAEGEDVQGIDFSLARGGVITGKVTDADGRPVIEERLTIVPEDQAKQGNQMFPQVVSGVFQTDDRGIYRIFGIPDGRYKISVGLGGDAFSSNVRLGRALYKRTFYPDAADPADARAIEVTEGSEATNIDITVARSLPNFAASGKILDGETGRPVVGMRFGLRRVVNNREAGVMPIFAASNSQGEFRLENIPPGKYLVFVTPQQGNEARAEAVPFEVIDQDVTGLVLTTFKGVTITGTVLLDGDKSVMTKLEQLHLQVYVRSENGDSPSWQESPISSDGSFRLGGLGPGHANFSLASLDRRPSMNFKILRVEIDGVVQPRGVEIKAGEQTTGVKIIVGYETGAIRGEVRLENGPLPPGGRVVVWIKKLGDTEQTFRPYNLDARGHFLIEGVAAGSYELNVSANVPRGQGPTAKQQIEVSEGTVTDVVVSLDLKPEPVQRPIP